jgi:class 3 adenylate cyclase/tetratricopeptide (TPR) repeat protein
VCAGCGRKFPSAARFCPWCGAPRESDPRHADVLGERKQATVLFADIVGSTDRIAGLDAEGAMNSLQPVVMVMGHAVRRFNGIVLRTLGDGIKAAFGVPHTLEGHAVLACQAALAMRTTIATLPDAPMIRIGIHAGEVVSGAFDIGSVIGQDATGLAVHLANRIEQLTPPGEICLSRACRTLVGAYYDTEPLGPRAFKGIPEPVEIYRLIGLKPAVNSEQFRGTRLVPLRGRAVELNTLRRALLDTAPDSPRVIGISGPPGVGKSRLCFEFAEWCRERQIRVLEARAHVFGQATPLLPILEALRTFFRIEPDMDAAAAFARIEQTLIALEMPVAEHLPILAEFLGYPQQGQSASAIDPRTRRARMRDVLGHIVKAFGRQTSVFILEDTHWLDEASHEFLQAWMESVEGTGVLLVLTFRPGWSPPNMPASHRELALTELGAEDVAQVIGDLIGDDPEFEEMIAHVAERSGGNPFFAEELVLSLAQCGVLLGERGSYRMGPSGWHNPPLPATVEAVIGARIDLLPESEKALLRIGAIIGKEFPLEVVRAVSGLPESAARSLLGRLCKAELIRVHGMSMGEGFAFRHPLIQEVAYAMQLRSTRADLHATVAKAITGQAWGQRDEFAGLLAHHCEAAGNELDAAMHLQRAARWIGRTNSGRALADWRKVHWLMRNQPRSAINDQLRSLAGGQILYFGWRAGLAAEEAKLYAEEALRLARDAGDRKHEMTLLASYGRVLAATGSADDYVRLVREAMALADGETVPGVKLLLNGLLTQAYLRAGLFREALAANDAALAILEDRTDLNASVVLGLNIDQMAGFDVAHWIRCQRPVVLIPQGRFDEAELSLARVLDRDPEIVQPAVQYLPHVAAVEIAWHRRDSGAAKWHADKASAYADQSGIPFLSVWACICRGLSSLTNNDFATAEQHLQGSLRMAQNSKVGLEEEPRILANLAETYVLQGDFERAAQTSYGAMEAARRRADRRAECHAMIARVIALAATRRAGWQNETTELISRVEELIGLTGAEIFRPMLLQAKLLVDTGPL